MCPYKRRKEDIEWGKKIRSIGKCEICGNTKNLNAHHILDKIFYKHLKFELENGICLCVRCHKFGRYSAHKNPVWFTYWMLEHKKEQLKWIIKHM